MNNSELPTGFSTVDDACELIKSDTRSNPVVDMDYLVAHVVWIEAGGNFRIPKIRRLNADEVYRTPRGRTVEYQHTGDVNVRLATNFEAELLKKTILDKYRELTEHEYKQLSVKARSTVADDAQGRNAVRPRNNAKPIAKEGVVIGGGDVITSNGDGLSV